MSYHRFGQISITRGRPNRINYPNRNRRCGIYNQNSLSHMYDIMEEFNYNHRVNYTTTLNMDRRGRIRNVIFNSSFSNGGRFVRYRRRRCLR